MHTVHQASLRMFKECGKKTTTEKPEKWEETSEGGYLTTKETNLTQCSEAFQIPERYYTSNYKLSSLYPLQYHVLWPSAVYLIQSDYCKHGAGIASAQYHGAKWCL